MFLGSHCVHMYYRPLEDLEELLKKAEEKQLAEQEIKRALGIPQPKQQ